MVLGGSVSQAVGLPNNSYKPITNTAWVRAQLCKLQKGCIRLAATSDKVYQLLAQGRWFSPGIPASSTTKTGRHDIAEILLNVAFSTTFKFNIVLTILISNIILIFFFSIRIFVLDIFLFLNIQVYICLFLFGYDYIQ